MVVMTAIGPDASRFRDSTDVEKVLQRPKLGISFGLMGLQERAEVPGGRIDFESRPDGGSSLLARCPIASDQPLR
jgi:signal transduction histidine kinase